MDEIELIKKIVENIYNFELLKELVPKEYSMTHEISITDMKDNTLLGYDKEYINYQLLDEFISKKRKPNLELKTFMDYKVCTLMRYNYICKEIPYKDPKYNFIMYIQNGLIYQFHEIKKPNVIPKIVTRLENGYELIFNFIFSIVFIYNIIEKIE